MGCHLLIDEKEKVDPASTVGGIEGIEKRVESWGKNKIRERESINNENKKAR